MKTNTFTFDITVPIEDIQKEYQHTLKSIQSDFETKGFRKGKAPIDVVEQNLSKEKLIEEVVNHLLSHIYEQKIKENNLKPIIQPQIKIKNPPLALDKEWQIEITSCELPEIKIDEKYSEEIKKINLQPETEAKEKKLDQILESLIKASQVDLPSILIDNDIENRLSQLVDQTNQAGITIAQYFKNKKQTPEQYKESLKEQITKEWTLNLAINKIATEQKIEISQQEVQEITTKNPALSSNLNLVYFFLTQQKVFEYLQNLK